MHLLLLSIIILFCYALKLLNQTVQKGGHDDLRLFIEVRHAQVLSHSFIILVLWWIIVRVYADFLYTPAQVVSGQDTKYI